MEEWDYSKNTNQNPRKLTKGSDVQVFWICEFGHNWKTSVKKRALLGRGCHVCSHQVASPETSLAGHKEFSNITKEWDKDLNLQLQRTIHNTTSKSRYRAWWRCSKHPNHIPWQAPVCNRTIQQTGTCPQCSSIFQHRFDLMLDWDDDLNPNQDPRTISLGSGRLIRWRCRYNPLHIWNARVADRTGGSKIHGDGQGCPSCSLHHRSKIELEIAFELNEFLDVEMFPNKISNPTGRDIQIDMFIPSINLIIEYDGYYWHSPNHKYSEEGDDLQKNIILEDLGYKVLRIREGMQTISRLDVSLPRGASAYKCTIVVLEQLLNVDGILDQTKKKVLLLQHM